MMNAGTPPVVRSRDRLVKSGLRVLVRSVFFAIAVLGSWALTAIIYDFVTGSGRVYTDALAIYREVSGGSTEIGDFRLVVSPRQDGSAYIRFFIGPAEDNYLGRTNVVVDNGVLKLMYSHPFSLWGRLAEIYGPGSEQSEVTLASLSNPNGFLPHSRDLVVDIPVGSLSPQIRLFIDQAITARDLQVDEEELRLVSDRGAELIMQSIQYDTLVSRFQWIGLYGGRIQFVTLWVFIGSMIFLVYSIFSGWGLGFSSNLAEALPYIGFLGTLVGMGQALAVLGRADLTNALSKATSLGPIGSNISLAVQTTIYALILSLIASFVAGAVALQTEGRGRR